MYNLAIESQKAVEALIDSIDVEEIRRRGGKLIVREQLELSLHDALERLYLVPVTRGAELCFWHTGGSSYGQKSKDSTYSKTRYTIFAPDSSFQLKYDSRGSGCRFVFQWLANRPLLEAGRVAQLI